MRDIKNLLTSGKNLNKKNNRRTKSFGYQVLGFGSGGSSLAPNPFTADYLMVAGGGAGRGGIGGGGGAGGLLYSYCNSCAAGIGLDAGLFNITIGAGGSAGLGSDTTIISCGALACISKTATRGGHGPGPGGTGTGGSGAGGGHGQAGNAGNTPPVSVPLGGPQGSAGGGGAGGYGASGGGGRGGAGGTSQPSSPVPLGGPGGAGGVGLTGMSISGSPLSYAGGGGGGAYNPGTAGAASPCGTGGAGVPGTGPTNAGPSNNGTTNRGGGGGGNGESAPTSAPKVGSGGSGVVILRYPNSICATIAPGTNTIACAPGSTKIATFTVTGTLCVAGG